MLLAGVCDVSVMFLLKQSVLRLFALLLSIETFTNRKFVSKRCSHLQGLHLADKSTCGTKVIEILVGLDYYFEFVTVEVIKGKYGERVALKSSFGYILSDQYKIHSTVSFNETHSSKIQTETDANFKQQSFDTNVTHLFNEIYYDESINERSYLIRDFQNNLKHNRTRYEVKIFLSAKIKPSQTNNYLLAKAKTGNLLKQLATRGNILTCIYTYFYLLIYLQHTCKRES